MLCRKCSAWSTFSAQQWALHANVSSSKALLCEKIAGTRIAPAVHSIRSLRAPAAHFDHQVCESCAWHTALIDQVCMQYTARAVSTVSALTDALCTSIVHCRFTYRALFTCSEHVVYTVSSVTGSPARAVKVHTTVHLSCALYTVSALTSPPCTCSIHCKCI